MGQKLADTLAYPPRALRANRAAALSLNVHRNVPRSRGSRTMPKPKKLRGIVFWDRVALDDFVERYEGDEDESENAWDKYLGQKP
jgi:hypothetical protein